MNVCLQLLFGETAKSFLLKAWPQIRWIAPNMFLNNSVGHDLGPNPLQRLSATDKSGS